MISLGRDGPIRIRGPENVADDPSVSEGAEEEMMRHEED